MTARELAPEQLSSRARAGLVAEPETRAAMLVNELTGCATRHRYVRTEICRSRMGGIAIANAFIFRCEATGIERRWGLEIRTAPAAAQVRARPSARAPELDAGDVAVDQELATAQRRVA